MFRASAEITLPTSIIGSLPRPSWYTAGLGAQNFLEAMTNLRWREQYEDAVSVYLRAQETAGLDIVTDGDAHFDEQVSGMSWQSYPLTHMAGFSRDAAAERLSDGRRRPAARPYPARFARSARLAAHRRAGRSRQSAICGDVEDGAAADAKAGQVRHHPAGTPRRLGRRRLLPGPGRARLGLQRGAQPGAPSTGRCGLPGDPAGGAADPHGAGARQDLRQARRGRAGQNLQQHGQRIARQDRIVVPHLLGQPGAAADLPRHPELPADPRRPRPRRCRRDHLRDLLVRHRRPARRSARRSRTRRS